jgi:hypothetical protein
MKMQVGLLADKTAIDSFDVDADAVTRSTIPGRVRAELPKRVAVRVVPACLPQQCQLSLRQGKHELHQMVGRTASRACLCPKILLHGYENGERLWHGPGET